MLRPADAQRSATAQQPREKRKKKNGVLSGRLVTGSTWMRKAGRNMKNKSNTNPYCSFQSSDLNTTAACLLTSGRIPEMK